MRFDSLDDGWFTTADICAMIGRSSSSTLTPHRLGRYLRLDPIGTGNRYDPLTPRHAVIACVAVDILGPGAADKHTSGRLLASVADALWESEWGDYLALNDDGYRMLDAPEDVARFVTAHAPLATTVVPLYSFYERVIA